MWSIFTVQQSLLAVGPRATDPDSLLLGLENHRFVLGWRSLLLPVDPIKGQFQIAFMMSNPVQGLLWLGIIEVILSVINARMGP